MIWSSLGLFGLFASTFIAATILPFFPSEGVLVAYYIGGSSIIPALIIATVGNFLGGMTNYYIGRSASSEKLKKKFKLNEKRLKKWVKHLSKWGVSLGLLAWLPFVGDPMLIALGFFKVRIIPLSIMVFVGKFLRYLILTLIYLQSI